VGVIGADFPTFFAAIAAAAAALTGLLFVAMSVAPRHGPGDGPPVIREVRAAAALLAFVNTLAVSLFGLVPTNNVGYPAVALGVIGIFFTAAAIRSIFASASMSAVRLQQLELVVILLLIFGTELITGIVLIADSGQSTAVEVLGNALVASLLVGVARAWELVGNRDTGIIASISVLMGHTPGSPRAGGFPAAPPGAGEPDPGGQDSGKS
jgi:hypothetical protein